MCLRWIFILGLLLCCALQIHAAQAEARLALVIGNGNYGDGSAWIEESCAEHGIRGSGYLRNVWQSRFAMRDKLAATGREVDIGFRLARDLD
jgi:hypothetical protein